MARALWATHFTFQDKSQIYKEIPPKIYMPLAIESDVVITQKYLPSLSFLKGLLLLGELSYRKTITGKPTVLSAQGNP